LPQLQFFCSVDALVMPLFLVLMMALTSVASVRTIRTDRSTTTILWSEEFTTTIIMGDTTSSGMVSARGILQLAMPSADSMEVAVIGSRRLFTPSLNTSFQILLLNSIAMYNLGAIALSLA
jgi:hypothetical protein